MAINAGDGQSAAVGTAVAIAPSVIVRDQFNNPVAGVSVTFAVASGGGTVDPTTAVTTDASGIAAVTSWTLGATAGTNTLTATSSGVAGSPVTFTATAISTGSIAINAGDAQSAAVGTAVAVPPSVIVRDGFDQPAAGVPVTFAVASGGGAVEPTTAVTTPNFLTCPITIPPLGEDGPGPRLDPVRLPRLADHLVVAVALGTPVVVDRRNDVGAVREEEPDRCTLALAALHLPVAVEVVA